MRLIGTTSGKTRVFQSLAITALVAGALLSGIRAQAEAQSPPGVRILAVKTEAEALEIRARQESEAWGSLWVGTELGKAGDAVEMTPDVVDAYFNLAIAHWKLGQMEAAIAAMRRVVQLRPDDFEGQMRLGSWLFDQSRYLEACEVYERAALLEMDSWEVWLRLAQSYDTAGRAKAAVNAYRRVIGLLEGDDPALYGSLLRVAMQAGDGPVAVTTARKLKAFRTDHEGFLALGEALLLNGEAEAAVLELQKAVALAPSSAAAQAGLGSAYARVGQTEVAAERFVRAAQLEPENPEHYRTLARLYEGLGRLDLAIVALRDGVSAAATRSPTVQAEVAEELSALYDRAGMGREAARERLRAQGLRAP